MSATSGHEGESKEARMAEKTTAVTTRSPFRMLERFSDEMDRLFDDFGFSRRGVRPRSGQGWLRGWPTAEWEATWSPEIEVHHRNNELVVRADLPGLKKDDVKVEVTEDAVTIEGERRHEHETERGGVYRSERSYGSFRRTIPLPEGAIVDQAKANFKDGVLEITMPAPPEHAMHGRRLEISEGSSTQK
jgi:HSP20 family protein